MYAGQAPRSARKTCTGAKEAQPPGRGWEPAQGQTGLMPPATGFSALGALQEPGLQAVPRHKATCLVCCGCVTFLEGGSRN